MVETKSSASRSRLKRAVKIGVAILLLAVLYRAADWRAVLRVLGGVNAWWLSAGLLLFIPQTLVSALRWRRWTETLAQVSLADAIRQTLAASALNLFVPSKLGDLTKAVMLDLRDPGFRAIAAFRAVTEKAVDVAVLAALLLFGASIPPWAWLAASASLQLVAIVLRRSRTKKSPSLVPTACEGIELAALSIPLWMLHLLQIHCFLFAAGVHVSWAESVSRVPLAIFAGLLPISFCGFGTRDAALIWLFADLAPASTMAAVGLLTGLRYLLPGLAGLPFVSQVWSARFGTVRHLSVLRTI